MGRRLCNGRGSNPWALSASCKRSSLLEILSPPRGFASHFLAGGARALRNSMAFILRVAVSCQLRHSMERKISLWKEARIHKTVMLPEGRRTFSNLQHLFAEVNGREVTSSCLPSDMPVEVSAASACNGGHTDHERSVQDDGHRPVKASKINEIMQKLKRYGISGVLSYGLLNTVYYLLTFVLVWFFIAPAPGRMGYGDAVERFFKVLAMVWAGSQVTKLARAGGILKSVIRVVGLSI